jgi:uncharacterized protein
MQAVHMQIKCHSLFILHPYTDNTFLYILTIPNEYSFVERSLRKEERADRHHKNMVAPRPLVHIRSIAGLSQLGRFWQPWLYLVLIMAAELLITFTRPLSGLFLHAVLVVLLTLHATLGRSVAKRQLFLVLVIVPLLRLLTLSLPLAGLPWFAWYAVVSSLLLVAAVIMVRQLRLTSAALGLRPCNTRLQLLLIGLGPGLGLCEYLILKPAPLILFSSWQDIWVPTLVLIVFTGFSEEFIFRGLLQSVTQPVLGSWTIGYGALLFAVMHIGYRSVIDILFVFGVGLLFGKIVAWSGSLLGVSLAHGLTNVILLIVIPHAIDASETRVILAAPWVLLFGTAMAGAGILLLWRQSCAAKHLPTLVPVMVNVRALRRAAQLTYVELAQRSNLPARLIAEIEHGWCRPEPEHLNILVRAIGTRM